MTHIISYEVLLTKQLTVMIFVEIVWNNM